MDKFEGFLMNSKMANRDGIIFSEEAIRRLEETEELALCWKSDRSVVFGKMTEVEVTRDGDDNSTWLDAHGIFEIDPDTLKAFVGPGPKPYLLYPTFKASVDGDNTFVKIVEVSLSTIEPNEYSKSISKITYEESEGD